MTPVGYTLTTWTAVTAFATGGAAIAAAVAAVASWRAMRADIRQRRDDRKRVAGERFEDAVYDLERRLERLGDEIVELAEVARVAGASSTYTVKQREVKMRLAALRPFSRPLPVCETLGDTPADAVTPLIQTALDEIEAETRRVLFEGPPGRPAVQAARMLVPPPSPLDWTPSGDPTNPGPLPAPGQFYPAVTDQSKRRRRRFRRT